MAYISIFSKLALIMVSAGVLLSVITVLTHIKPPKNPTKIWLLLGLSLCIAAILSSLVGYGAYVIETIELEEALSMAMPEYVDAMRKQGEGYADVPIKIAMGNIIPLMVGIFTFIRARRSKNDGSV